MERKPVNSSMIKAVGYDAMEEILEIEFSTNGSIYQYKGVPQVVYDELMEVASAGVYFRQNIKDEFESEKVSG